MSETGHILVVDDTASMRAKLAAAARALGHTVTAAGGGAEALRIMREGNVDAVLLDIMMPEMDGFEVLATMKEDSGLRNIPVIVVSGLDDTESAVKAIELGAEDFLPKNFDPVIFRARVNTLLQKKFVRDAEVDYLRQVDRIAKAAQILRTGSYNPARLGLQEIALRNDALGDLARVFGDAAQKVYERERLLRHTIKTMRGGIGLVILGVVWGLVVPLSKMASQLGAHPFGLALWVSLISGISCTAIAGVKGWLPRWSAIPWSYLLAYALVGAALSESLLFLIAGKVDASIVSIIVVFEGFIAFGFAAAMGLEKPSVLRFTGLALGLGGVFFILFGQLTSTTGGNVLWTVAALSIPICYALEGVLLAQKRPEGMHVVAIFAIMQLLAAAMLLPLAWMRGEIFALGSSTGTLDIVVLMIAAASAVANILFFYLIQNLGSVFASQNAYFTTAAGIGWSMLILGETLTGWVWAAIGMMAIGLFLVGAKHEAELEVPDLPDPRQGEPA